MERILHRYEYMSFFANEVKIGKYVKYFYLKCLLQVLQYRSLLTWPLGHFSLEWRLALHSCFSNSPLSLNPRLHISQRVPSFLKIIHILSRNKDLRRNKQNIHCLKVCMKKENLSLQQFEVNFKTNTNPFQFF